MEHIESSYAINNYGPIFYNTVVECLPRTAVEIGILHGYSTLWIAKGIAELHNIHNQKTKFYAFDLFEDYQYNHGTYEEVHQLLVNHNLKEYVTIEKLDAWEVYKKFSQNSVDFLHVDISNDGDVLNKIIDQWHNVLSFGGVLLFEGGSKERDEIKWMKKYNKKSIRQEMENNELIKKKYLYGNYEKYPSLTVLIKKG